MGKKDRSAEVDCGLPELRRVSSDTYGDAIQHANAISQVGEIPGEKHAVAQTNLEYGSRHEKGSKR